MKKKTQKKIDNPIKVLLDSIMNGIEEEDKKSPIFKFAKENIQYLKDPEDFYVTVIGRINGILRTFVKSQTGGDCLVSSIYTNYGFYEYSISELCKKFYGAACCVDKARFLLRCAIEWKRAGKIPVFNWKQEYTYHIPETGSPKQWMSFIDGLYSLLYGRNKPYIMSLVSLEKMYRKGKRMSVVLLNRRHDGR